MGHVLNIYCVFNSPKWTPVNSA